MSDQVILYVEDDESDVLLLQFAFSKAGITNPVITVKNGEQAVAYLQGSGSYADRNQYPLPYLLLLDLNMPRFPGLKLLEWIRRQPQFSSLRIVVYTSLENAEEKQKAQQLGANDFIVKPCGVEETVEMCKKLKETWLRDA